MRKRIINKNFWKTRNNYITIFIISLIVIVASIGLLIYFINKRNDNLHDQENYFNLDIVDKRTGANIYMELYERPLLVDYDRNDNTDLFYIEKNNKYYFIESDLSLIDEIKLFEYENGRKIVGNVVKMDDKIKEKVINFVENKLGITIKEEDINNYISLNLFEYSPYYYMFEYFIACFIGFIFGIIGIYNYVYIYQFNKNMKKLTAKEINEISDSINDSKSVYVTNGINNYIDGIYLCDKYMIDTKTLNIYYYVDIIQICFKKKYMKYLDAYKMLINFQYTDKFIKITIVSDEFKDTIEKYIQDKKLNIITYEE